MIFFSAFKLGKGLAPLENSCGKPSCKNLSDHPRSFAVPVNSLTGFTLIEVLLVLALLGLIVGLAAPVVWSFSMQNDLDLETAIAAQTMRRAQSLAVYGSNDSSWGVKLESRDVTLFSGSSFAGRDLDFDEVFHLPSVLTVAGPSEIIFSKLNGQPGATGTLVLSNNIDQSRTLNINAAGMVAY